MPTSTAPTWPARTSTARTCGSRASCTPTCATPRSSATCSTSRTSPTRTCWARRSPVRTSCWTSPCSAARACRPGTWRTVTARAERIALLVALVGILVAAPAARAADPFVVVDAALHKGDTRATITATVRWNADFAAGNLNVGDLRAVAVDRDTAVATPLARTTRTLSPQDPVQRQTFTITASDKLAALRSGNRVTLTATQHQVL